MKRILLVLICGILISGCGVKATLDEGKDLQEQKKFAEAIDKYQQVLKRDPNGKYSELAKQLINECDYNMNLDDGDKLSSSLRFKEAKEKYKAALNKDASGKNKDKIKQIILDCDLQMNFNEQISHLKEGSSEQKVKIQRFINEHPATALAKDLQEKISKKEAGIYELKQNIRTAFVKMNSSFTDLVLDVNLDTNEKQEYLVTIKIARDSGVLDVYEYMWLFGAMGSGFSWYYYPAMVNTIGHQTGYRFDQISGWGTNTNNSYFGQCANSVVGINIAKYCIQVCLLEEISDKYDGYGKKVSDHKRRIKLNSSYTMNKEDASKINWNNLGKVSGDVFVSMIKYQKLDGNWEEIPAK